MFYVGFNPVPKYMDNFPKITVKVAIHRNSKVPYCIRVRCKSVNERLKAAHPRSSIRRHIAIVVRLHENTYHWGKSNTAFRWHLTDWPLLACVEVSTMKNSGRSRTTGILLLFLPQFVCNDEHVSRIGQFVFKFFD